MAVVPGLGPGEVGAVAPGLEVDDGRRPGGEGGFEVGELETLAEVGREAEFAGDADDVERMRPGLGSAAESGGETVLALLRSPVGQDGLEGGRPAGVAGALADVGDAFEQRGEGGGGGGGDERGRGDGQRRQAGRVRCGRPAEKQAGRERADEQEDQANRLIHLHEDAPEKLVLTSLSWNRIRSGVKREPGY